MLFVKGDTRVLQGLPALFEWEVRCVSGFASRALLWTAATQNSTVIVYLMKVTNVLKDTPYSFRCACLFATCCLDRTRKTFPFLIANRL